MARRSEKDAVKLWNGLWKKTKIGEWDNLSETIYGILQREIIGNNSFILEAGSGTGRISLKLRQEKKGNVILLDVSKEAILTSKKIFNNQNQEGVFIVGSIFKMPIKHNSVDVTWNAGVLEHFTEYQRKLALKEMAVVCKENGLVITLNPYSKAVFYRIGKWFAEKRNKWRYGFEKPVKSMVRYTVDNCTWVSEYSTGFETSLHFLSNIPFLRYFIPIFLKVLQILPTNLLNHIGYLVVSIAEVRRP